MNKCSNCHPRLEYRSRGRSEETRVICTGCETAGPWYGSETAAVQAWNKTHPATGLQRARQERDEAVKERQRLQVSLDLLDDTVRQKVAENARQFKQIEELHVALDKATAQVAKLGDKLITAAREGRKNDL